MNLSLPPTPPFLPSSLPPLSPSLPPLPPSIPPLSIKNKRPITVIKSSYGSVNMEKKITAAMVYLDQKLILIPLVFIFLRFWGTLRFFISFLSSCHTPCDNLLIVTEPCKTALYHPFLMVMQAICDPGQGWGNALVFVIFHKTLFKRVCPCLFYIGEKISTCCQAALSRKRDSSSSTVNDSSVRRSYKRVSGNVEFEDEEDGHHTPLFSDECDKTHGFSNQSSTSNV